jgi:pyruvate kinase
MPKRTKIIATVGPASSSRDMVRSLMQAGVDVFRINFSHGSHEQRAVSLELIRELEQELGRPVAVCGDLCGPKIRVGIIADGEIVLRAGQQIVIQRAPCEGTTDRISTTFPELIDLVQPGETVMLADGQLQLEVSQIGPPDSFTCRVLVGGPLSSGKGVNLPQTEITLSALTEKDRADVEWIAARDFDFVALSFVQRPHDVTELRELMARHGCSAHIIVKIEKPQALQHIDGILDVTDAVMVARGDLGVEMEFPEVPIAQKSILQKCRAKGLPCIVATEMLESMIRSARPTRAEVSDVANAVFDEADAVMLSGETSIGQYPLEAVRAMHRTVLAAERYVEPHTGSVIVPLGDSRTMAALARAILGVMETEQIAAVMVLTESGRSARLVSKNRPNCPVVAISPHQRTVRRCCLYYGVVPQRMDVPQPTDAFLRAATDLSQQLELAAPGQRVIVVAGHPVGAREKTNGMVIQLVK